MKLPSWDMKRLQGNNQVQRAPKVSQFILELQKFSYIDTNVSPVILILVTTSCKLDFAERVWLSQELPGNFIVNLRFAPGILSPSPTFSLLNHIGYRTQYPH